MVIVLFITCYIAFNLYFQVLQLINFNCFYSIDYENYDVRLTINAALASL